MRKINIIILFLITVFSASAQEKRWEGLWISRMEVPKEECHSWQVMDCHIVCRINGRLCQV